MRSLALLLLFAHAVFSQETGFRLPQDQGRAGLEQALMKLRTTARLLHITAHPDDEDGAMLTWQARAQGGEVMLLTLTRGEGGQNKTGSDLFDELGVLRTLELLESDRYYGVQQRFTRLVDFGFTKSPQEALDKWQDGEPALDDMVRVIRTFRPDVVASRYQGSARDGHGHHQAAGLLTLKAVKAVADPKRFPEQINEGLLPWQVMKLYIDNLRPGEEYNLGSDPKTEFAPIQSTFARFAMQGLRHQASQGGADFPSPFRMAYRTYKLMDATIPGWSLTQREQDFFDGINTTVAGLADRLGPEERKLPGLAAKLKALNVSSMRRRRRCSKARRQSRLSC